MSTKPTTHTETHESMPTTKPKHATKTIKTPTLTTSTESESAPMKTVNHVTSSASVTAPATAAAAPIATSPLPFVKAPPPITLPAVPSDTVVVQPAVFRAQLPRKEELALIPEAQTELQRFTDYPAVFGKTAPAQAVVEQTLSSAYQWSTLRQQLAAWATYALGQEVTSWVATRSVVARLSPAFGLAVKTDSTIGESYPSLGELFGVRATIARRGAAARKANAQAESEGKPAYKGAAGKRRQKADEKAALLARQAAEAHAATATAPAVPAAQVPVNVGTVGHA